MVQLSHLYVSTGKTIALTIRIFVGKVRSLVFKMLFTFVTAFLPRSKRPLISWLQSPSAVMLLPNRFSRVRLFETPGFPVHHQLSECTQTHVHRVGDAIQPPYPLSSRYPPAFNLS